MAKKSGETLVISVRALDASGDQQSETTHEINGLSNARANAIYNGIVASTKTLVEQLQAEKEKGND